jgi:WD40 repeat protein
LDAHSGIVRAIAFSLDGKTLVSGSQDKTVKVWEVQTRKLRHTLEGNKGLVDAVAFSPDGRLLATGGTVKEDGKYLAEVILWDARTVEPKQTFPVQNAFVHTLAFSPDGKTLAVGGGRHLDDAAKTTGELRLLPLE